MMCTSQHVVLEIDEIRAIKNQKTITETQLLHDWLVRWHGRWNKGLGVIRVYTILSGGQSSCKVHDFLSLCSNSMHWMKPENGFCPTQRVP